ncbi:MAG: hypothetical protein H3C39_03685 [Flavobacteriia bacterium]|nr:hypothetical protein [Flavobacteriia bacterium]
MDKSKVKIVLIGNGFDIAHGLKTRYADFLEFLSIDTYKNGKDCRNRKYSQYKHRIASNDIEDPWITVKLDPNKGYELNVNPHNERNSIYFKRLFLEKKDPASMKWADLETFYFNLLIEKKDDSSVIKTINEEFAYMKVLLEDYLINQIETLGVNKFDIDSNSIMKLLNNDKDFDQIYFITFNYTSKILDYYYERLSMSSLVTGEPYNKKFLMKPIHIHGKLNNEKNPIIFGYGDENSADYQELEDSLNDDLLVNFKTFQYLRTENYNQVLGLLNTTNDITVQIIGHSCGLCDKALLRKIFQHENVKRIQAVYHGDDSNYFSKLYSISRIFDDNTLMREKIIPLVSTAGI